MKSFYEILQENGYTAEQANSICVMIENDLQIKDEKVKKLHHNWYMRLITEGHVISCPELD